MSASRAEPVDARRRVTRDDIEAKFRELQGDVDQATDQAVPAILVAGAVVVVGVVLVAYALGRRRGRKKSTFIEVRRL